MRIAINGFGRIGRNVFKVAFENSQIEIVSINDLTNAVTLAHLLKYDSSYGVYGRKVEASGNNLIVDDKVIPVGAEKDPSKLPWKNLNVDVVIESTGLFTKATSDRGGYLDHLKAGAKKVLISAPADVDTPTVVLGVNEHIIADDVHVYSNASCTTNCLAPIAKVLSDKFGIIQGFMTTTHAYTNDQVTLDAPHKDLRRARTAAASIIPTTSGAAKAIGLVLPELTGKLNGGALRVPVSVGSLVDLVVQLENKEVTKEKINKAFKEASLASMKGILDYTEDPIVSHDIIGNPHSSTVDGLSTMVMERGLVKVYSWYDNEWGYSNRIVELALKLLKS